MDDKDKYMIEEENQPDMGGDSVVVDNRASQDYVVVDTSDVCVDESAPLQRSSMVYIAAYVLLYGATQIISKYLMDAEVSPFEILSARGSISVFLNLIYLTLNGMSLFDVEGSKASAFLLGALVGFLALCGHYAALNCLSLGTAFVVEYVSLHFTTFFDAMFFTYTFYCSHFIGYVAAAAGILWLTYGLRDESLSIVVGIVIGVLGSLLTGLHGIAVRKTVAKVNLILGLTFMEFISACFAPALAMLHIELRQEPVSYTWDTVILFAILGATGWAANLMLALAVQEEKLIAKPYMFKYALVVVGVLYDVWQGNFSLSLLAGAALVGVHFFIAML